MLKILNKISDCIQLVLEYFLLIIGTLLTVVNLAQICGRDLFFYSLPWSEQLSTWIFVWIVFLGYHLVLRKDAELTIDVIHFKNQRAQLALEIARDIFSLIMICVFFRASVQFLKNAIRYPQLMSSMPVNMYVVYAVMPVSFGIMAFQKALNMLVRISRIVKGEGNEHHSEEAAK